MINDERIVPIQKIDLLSMIGTTLGLIGTSYTALKATTITGAFSVTGSGSAGTFLANQPVQTLDFASGVTEATVYFIAAFDYAGFTVAGVAATLDETSVDVQADGVTLYKAVLASGEVTITAVTPSLSE